MPGNTLSVELDDDGKWSCPRKLEYRDDKQEFKKKTKIIQQSYQSVVAMWTLLSLLQISESLKAEIE